MDTQLANLSQVSDTFIGDLREKAIRLRALEKMQKQGTPEYEALKKSLSETDVGFQSNLSDIGEMAKKKAELEAGIETKNRAISMGVGIPGVAALTYGYEGFKDE